MPWPFSQSTICNCFASLFRRHISIVVHHKYPTEVGTLTPVGPNKISRHAQQHDAKTDAAVQRKLVKQAESYHTAGGDEEQRRKRMSRNAKHASRRCTPAKYKDARRG